MRALAGFYLGGGTAVAWHLGHRTSEDLDFFSWRSDVDLQSLARALVRKPAAARVIDRTDVSLRLQVAGVPVDIVDYPYALLAALQDGPEGVRVASLVDLGAMKLAALAQRGLRRDFWDVYEIVHAGLPLDDLIDAYRRRFGQKEANLYPVLRALSWFADAEAERAFPRGLTRARWSKIKRFFEEEAGRLLRALTGA